MAVSEWYLLKMGCVKIALCLTSSWGMPSKADKLQFTSGSSLETGLVMTLTNSVMSSRVVVSFTDKPIASAPMTLRL